MRRVQAQVADSRVPLYPAVVVLLAVDAEFDWASAVLKLTAGAVEAAPSPSLLVRHSARNTTASSTRITGITSKGCRGATDWV